MQPLRYAHPAVRQGRQNAFPPTRTIMQAVDITAELDRAAASLRAGRVARARRAAQTVLAARPGDPTALHLLGAALVRQGDFAQAIPHLEAAVSARPNQRAMAADLAAACLRHADDLFAAGKDDDARAAQRKAIASDPFFPRMRQAVQSAAEGRARDAEATYRDVLKADANHIHALVGLASIAIDRNAPEDAERLLARAMSVSPNVSPVHRALARLAMSRSHFEEAEAAARRAVQLNPELAESWTTLGTVLAWGLKQAEAATAFERALAINPHQARVQLSLGHVHKALGNTQASVRAYRDSVAADAGLGEAWWSLADLKTYRFTDAELDSMQAALKDTTLFGRDRAALHFAVAKAFEDRGEVDEAFGHYRDGNELRASRESFNVERFEQQCERLRSAFSKAGLATKAVPWGEGILPSRAPSGAKAEPIPIFVIGLPRSGSTLVDQILSSHSQVQGTMELPHVLGYVREFERGEGYPAAVERMTPEELRALGHRYLTETASHHGNARYFVDKMPNNFLHAGLIACMLPQAVFVDTRRHPLGCAFSIYKQNFARGQTFGYRLDTLAAYYNGYLKMMRHWQEALPCRVHRVIYEHMVDDTEAETRRLLEHCGLPFEESCLRFFESDRIVRTASAEQVRQPIYTGAKEHWHAFRHHLAPLESALGDAMQTWDA